ncbi:EpsG family protein [Erysipelatoclostridium sp. An173]|uniref:EpsG family protein n=1 Tax=Erysipelatoclostridium sp. An173 TaxID=1965571 RepID=UPI0013025BA5|nr:EpsG family protein [Erysipelatoclostridium sp. An173]
MRLFFYILYIITVIFLIYRAQSKQYSNKTKKSLYLLIAYILYIVVAVTRNIEGHYINGEFIAVGGIDAISYRNNFYLANTSLVNYINLVHGEIGFNTFMWVCYHLFGEFEFFLFIIHTIAFVLFWKYVKRGLQFKSFLYLLLVGSSLFTIFNTIRNDLAILLILHVISNLKQNQICKALIINLIALSIHSSSFVILIIIVVYFLYKNWDIKKYTKYSESVVKIIFSFFILVILYIIFSYLLPILFSSTEYNVYLSETIVSVSIYIFLIFLLFITYKYYHDISNKIEHHIIFIYLIIIGILNYFIQGRMYIAYRFILIILPFVYEYMFALKKYVFIQIDRSKLQHFWYKKRIINIRYIIRIILYLFIYYKIYDFFFVQLQVGGIV